MARHNKKRHGGRRNKTISVAVVAGMMPQAKHIYDRYRSGNSIIDSINRGLQTGMLGYNPDNKTWAIGNAKLGILPMLGGVAIHRIAGWLGLNRILARAGIPMLRI